MPHLLSYARAATVLAVAALFSACSQGESATQAPATSATATTPTDVSVCWIDAQGKATAPFSTPVIVKTESEWRAQLGPEVYAIARAKGTERPFCGAFYDKHESGVYTCVCCGLPLFNATSKFDSGTGWPSFFQPLAKENIAEHRDVTFGMIRTEIVCARCGCHLGHVFDDGPQPTGLRYCVDSASLVFHPVDDFATLAAQNPNGTGKVAKE